MLSNFKYTTVDARLDANGCVPLDHVGRAGARPMDGVTANSGECIMTPAAPFAHQVPGDPATILQTLEILCPEAQVEIRILDDKRMHVRRFHDHAAAAAWVQMFPTATGGYVVMNPFDEGRIEETRVDDASVTYRRWFLIDLHAPRPASTPATAAELAHARAAADGIKADLATRGWTDPLEAMSGNGWHLVYRIDLPNDDASDALVADILGYLGATYDTSDVRVDRAVANASRITRLYGTWARKGPSTPERPHRLSAITHIPESLTPVSLEAIQQVADLAPRELATPTPSGGPTDDVNRVLARVKVKRTLEESGTIFHQIECPWLSEHPGDDSGTVLTVNADGAIGFTCRHGQCVGRHWPDLRDWLDIETESTRYPPDRFPTTEMGDAEYFAACNATTVRYDHGTRRWMMFHGHHWAAQKTGDVYRLAVEAVRARQHAAVGTENRLRWALQGEARTRQTNLLALAQNIEPLADAGDHWDTATDLLGVKNGVIELRTGVLRPGRSEDRITLVSPLKYDDLAPTTRWKQFVLDVCDGDAVLADYFQVVFGYALTGETGEQCFWIFYGLGSNGKSTLLETLIRHVIPHHSSTMKFPSDKWSESISDYQKAQLVGRRLITTRENEQTQRLNTEFIKSLTGSEAIAARHPYGRPFTFVPVAKFILAVNHKPTILDGTHAMWRRVRMVPFLRTFSLDAGFAKSLVAEAPGALRWAVEGAVRYYREGLRTPESVLAATTDYQKESDSLTLFFESRCVFGEELRTKANPMFEALQTWYDECQTPRFQRESQKQFGQRIAKDSRFKVVPGKGPDRGSVFYVGVGLT